mmetsp:Transcript_97579/g.191595  ORF Transcript_97579/g.191595 Transcript_97579/m.191595 type:complete len:409 (-) Transcript_97579:175-1401(-)
MVKAQIRGERGVGCKFSMETFNTVRRFTAFTPIKYGPNPKRPGSKSFDRYAKYMKARTVGESLKLGTKIADLCWELQRGDYQLPKRTKAVRITSLTPKDVQKINSLLASIQGPRGLGMSMDAEGAAEALAQEEAWMKKKIELVRQTAKELRVKLEDETRGDLEEDGVHETADTRNCRLVAHELAQRILRDKAKKGLKVTEEDVTRVLRLWGFAMNSGRVNVLPGGRKWVYSDTLGAVLSRCSGYGITPPTCRYKAVPRLLNQWIQDNRPAGLDEDVVCTSININANYGARIHRDANNNGPSAIRAFGEYTGGELYYWSKDDKKTDLETFSLKSAQKHNIKKKTLIFDGNLAHAVAGFKGERISVVWFSIRNCKKLKAADAAYLKRECGFNWPTERGVAAMRRLCGSSR